LEATIPAAAEIPSGPMRGLELLETEIKGSLPESLLLDGLLLLAKMGREVSNGRRIAEGLMKGLLDGHGDRHEYGSIATKASMETAEATSTVLMLLLPLL